MRWVIWILVALVWCVIHFAGEVDTFWFVVGCVVLGLWLVLLLIVWWVNKTYGRGV